MARLGQNPSALAEGQIGLDRRRREQMAGLAEQPGQGRCRRLRGFRAAREGTKIHRRRRARHGRLEPRPRSAGGDVRQEVRLPETACARLHRSGAGARDGSQCRSRQDAVHRLQQVRRHHRAERDEGLFLRPRRQGDRRRQGRPPLHRGDRSRLVAGEGRRRSRVLPASSTASPRSADATPCSRRSGWSRRRPPASMSAA